MELNPFIAFLRKEAGFTFKPDLVDRLGRELPGLMAQRGIRSAEAYLALLARDPDAFHEVVTLLTVNETYFHREPDHLRLMTRRLVPEIAARKPNGEPIRILSAGCSSGEEPYSIVIALSEAAGGRLPADRYAVFGADIDADAIAKARRSHYGGRAFRALPPELRDRYFLPDAGGRFRIREALRRAVTFYTVNLLHRPYPPPLENMDLIFYRNVSIYFEPTIQRTIFGHLGDILNPGGYILVSSTETLSHDFKVLRLMALDGVFLYHKDPAGEEAPLPIGKVGLRGFPKSEADLRGFPKIGKPRRSSRSPHPSPPAAAERTAPTYEAALEAARNKRYDQALEILDRIIARTSLADGVAARPLKAAILINQGRTDAAKALCEDALDADPLRTEASLLLGMIARRDNDLDAAARRFKEALYGDTANWLAHFYLAEIYQSRGETQRMRREYGIVIDLLTRGGFSDHGLSFFSLPFTEAEIIHLCRQNMAS
jgi:chemotaxis protein methyltransferase CheR